MAKNLEVTTAGDRARGTGTYYKVNRDKRWHQERWDGMPSRIYIKELVVAKISGHVVEVIPWDMEWQHIPVSCLELAETMKTVKLPMTYKQLKDQLLGTEDDVVIEQGESK